MWPTYRPTGERVPSPVTKQRAASVPVLRVSKTAGTSGKENHAPVVLFASQLKFQFVVHARAQYVTQQGTTI